MSGKLKLSESEMNKPSEIESKFKIYKKPPNDPSYGDVTLMQHPSTREKVAMKERTVNTEDQFCREILKARARKKLKNEYLLNMKDYSTRKKKDFCSTFYVLRTFYEYEPNHLKKEILDRKNKGDSFSMEELTHLLYNTVEAGSYLQENGQFHGDIRPSQLLLTKKGTFKLGDRLNDPTPPPRNQFNNIVAGKDLYMSPNLYTALKKHNFKINHNSYKSDVFSLGMSILEAGLMRPLSAVYDEKSTEINFAALEGNLEEFSGKYQDNPLLVTTVSKMIEVNEQKRPDFINIKGAIPSYSEILDYFEKGDEEDYYEEDFTDPHHGDMQMQGNFNAPPPPPQDYSAYGGYDQRAPPRPQNQGMHPQGPPQPTYDQYGNPLNTPQQNYGGYNGYPPQQPNQQPPQSGFNNYPPMTNPPLQQQPVGHQNKRMPQAPAQQQFNPSLKQRMPQQGYHQGGPNSQNAPPPSTFGGFQGGSQSQYDQYGNPVKPHQSAPQPQGRAQPAPQGQQYPSQGYGQPGNHSPQKQSTGPAKAPYQIGQSQDTQGSQGGQQQQGKTKIIDGKAYKEVKVECTEMNDQGQKVRRIYIRYVPVDEADQSQSSSQNGNSSYGKVSQPAQQSGQNSYFAKNRGQSGQQRIGNYHGHSGYGNSGYSGN